MENLVNYATLESWKYCEKCHIIEPNKMLPTYGNQKMGHTTSCIYTKGRYFVPMVWFFCILSSSAFCMLLFVTRLRKLTITTTEKLTMKQIFN